MPGNPPVWLDNVSALGRGSPLLWLVGGAVNRSSLCFLLAFHSFQNHRVPACPSLDGVSLLFNTDCISVWAACSTDPRRAGQPGLSSVSPRGNRFPTLPPSVLSRVFETDLVPFEVPKNKIAAIGI